MTLEPSEPPSYGRVLRHRPTLLLWLSQIISQSGDFIFDIALLWLVIQTTGSVAAVGLVVAVVLLPVVFLGPIAGVYVDRFNRRSVLMVAEAFQGVVVLGMAGLLLLHDLYFPVLLLLVFLLNAGGAIARVTSTAIIPSLVERSDLGAANGLFSMSGSVNQLASLGLGGIVVALFGVETPILYDAITFFVALALVSLISSRLSEPREEGAEAAAKTSFGHDFVEGFAYLRKDPFMSQLVVIAIALNFFGAMMVTLVAPFAKFALQGNASAYGFMGASMALGTLVGSTVLGKLPMRRTAGPMLFAGVLIVGVGCILWGFTHELWETLVATAIVGVGLAAANLPISVLFQAKVPKHLLGRVGSALGSGTAASQPVGALLAGLLAASLTVGPVYSLCGAAILIIGLLGFAALRDLRRASF